MGQVLACCLRRPAKIATLPPPEEQDASAEAVLPQTSKTTSSTAFAETDAPASPDISLDHVASPQKHQSRQEDAAEPAVADEDDSPPQPVNWFDIIPTECVRIILDFVGVDRIPLSKSFCVHCPPSPPMLIGAAQRGYVAYLKMALDIDPMLSQSETRRPMKRLHESCRNDVGTEGRWEEERWRWGEESRWGEEGRR